MANEASKGLTSGGTTGAAFVSRNQGTFDKYGTSRSAEYGLAGLGEISKIALSMKEMRLKEARAETRSDKEYNRKKTDDAAAQTTQNEWQMEQDSLKHDRSMDEQAQKDSNAYMNELELKQYEKANPEADIGTVKLLNTDGSERVMFYDKNDKGLLSQGGEAGEPIDYTKQDKDDMKQAEKEIRDEMGASDWIPFNEPEEKAIRQRANEIKAERDGGQAGSIVAPVSEEVIPKQTETPTSKIDAPISGDRKAQLDELLKPKATPKQSDGTAGIADDLSPLSAGREASTSAFTPSSDNSDKRSLIGRLTDSPRGRPERKDTVQINSSLPAAAKDQISGNNLSTKKINALNSFVEQNGLQLVGRKLDKPTKERLKAELKMTDDDIKAVERGLTAYYAG
jgi:hypothetical protein